MALEILEDSEHLATLNQLHNAASPYIFEPASNTPLKLSNSASSFWLRLKVRNIDSAPLDWYLTYGDTTCDYLKIFVVETDGTVSMAAEIDDNQPFETRPVNYRKPAVLINTPAGKTQWIYLLKKADSIGSVNPRLFRLWGHDAFNQYRLNEYTLLGVAMGVLVAMVLYNLFIMVATCDNAYAYYVVYVVAVFLSWLTYLGLANQYTFTDSTFIPDMGTAFFGSCVQLCGTPYE
ncbi:MAG: 7TM-DISM domain-containing protein [Pseudomonadota bacterium]